ncbi:MAG: hypothetical protein K2I46_01770, partial [Clostridia bacterium]|nr:hypothetical protein [Clostridia bacterium]
MIKSNNKKKILTLLTITLAVVIVLSCVIGIFADRANISNFAGDISDSVISTPLARPTTPTTGGFSYFTNGVKYVFTNKDKVDGFRAGTEQFDMTTVIVNSSDVQGTQTNPHVITTIDEWEVFVKKMATDSTHGTGQYYVLGNDLDFAGKAFHPIVNFKGTFYGLGYSLKNITCDTWQYWTGSAYANIGASNMALGGVGVFCRIMESTITDLIVRDYSFQNAPANMTALNTNGPYVGGVAGTSYGNNNILNCHTVGEIRSTISYAMHPCASGIVGIHYSSGNILLAYRCSAEVVVDCLPDSGHGLEAGGIVALTSGATTYIYDCVANCKATLSTGTTDWSGAAIGWASGPTYVENFVGTYSAITSKASAGGALMGLSASANGAQASNVYVEGRRGVSENALTTSIRLASGTGKFAVANMSNINVVKISTNYASLYNNITDATTNITAIIN